MTTGTGSHGLTTGRIHRRYEIICIWEPMTVMVRLGVTQSHRESQSITESDQRASVGRSQWAEASSGPRLSNYHQRSRRSAKWGPEYSTMKLRRIWVNIAVLRLSSSTCLSNTYRSSDPFKKILFAMIFHWPTYGKTSFFSFRSKFCLVFHGFSLKLFCHLLNLVKHY